MFEYSLTYRTVPDMMVYTEQVKDANPNIVSVAYNPGASTLKIFSSSEIYGAELSIVDAISPASTPTINIVIQSINAAIEFGAEIMELFAAENVLLGITAADKTNDVRIATKDIRDALSTGSLYDAITEAKTIPTEDKDATFLTDARLLEFVNKIETYLGITLSTDLT